MRAHDEGIVTSTSLMINMPATSDALTHVVAASPELGVGLHVCLTSGLSVADRSRLSLLVDQRGRFCHSAMGIRRLLRGSDGAEGERQIATELSAQFEKASRAGLSLDHVDSHQHVHMLPGVFRITVQLARRYGVPAIRLPAESSRIRSRGFALGLRALAPKAMTRQWGLARLARARRLRAEGLWSPDGVFGVVDSGRIDCDVLAWIAHTVEDGDWEIICHPSLGDRVAKNPDLSDKDRAFVNSEARRAEFRALIDHGVAKWFKNAGVEFVTHRQAWERVADRTILETARPTP
jgi:predicted glycoside hydrolase/deacetylase ChbG (UPF0249 family)